MRTERGELATAKQAAEARAAELTKTVEQATAKAREMDQELVAVRWQNAQLNTSLAQARTSGEQMEAEARRDAERPEEPDRGSWRAAAEQTSGETARLRKQIEASEQRIAVAERARTEAEARLGEMRDTRASGPSRTKARIGADLAKVQGELASAKQQAGREHAEIGERVAALENERDELRTRLADVTAGLRQSETTKAQLESEVAELREAAGAATDAARQNLIAVENQIRRAERSIGCPRSGGWPVGNRSCASLGVRGAARTQSGGRRRTRCRGAGRECRGAGPDAAISTGQRRCRSAADQDRERDPSG